MKTKVMLLMAVGILCLGVGAQAGPQVSVFIGAGGGGCYRPAPICGPGFYRPWPVAAFQPSFYYWGPTVVSYLSGSSTRFSNVSPMMNYTDGAPVYKVPSPVLLAEPLTVYPASTFGWKR